MTLLLLDRVAEAEPIVRGISKSGYTNPDLAALVREKGLGGDSAKR